MGRTVDATVARRQLGTLLDEVYYKGESIIIERKGKPLAKLAPLSTHESNQESAITPRQRKLIDELNSLPTVEIKEEPTDLLRKIREKRAAEVKVIYGK